MPNNPDKNDVNNAKRAAAEAALALVEDGMKIGLGTGSTAKWFVDLLGERVRAGELHVSAVATSQVTEDQARSVGITLDTLDALQPLDLTVDGTDEFDPRLDLIKGGGGALLREKMVAAASKRMIVIADHTKAVDTLGAFALPVEIVRFGVQSTIARIAAVLGHQRVPGHEITQRMIDAEPFITDEGHYILDLGLEAIADPAALDTALNRIPGVVETGLFCGMCHQVIMAQADGRVRRIGGGE